MRRHVLYTLSTRLKLIHNITKVIWIGLVNYKPGKVTVSISPLS